LHHFGTEEGKAVRTRIRHYRKLRGMTQTELASRVGTTAATVSRLETADMTVSMDWLQKFAEVFRVRVSDLIEDPRPGRVPCIGEIGRGGTLLALAAGYVDSLAVETPARDPVAIRMKESVGGYFAGDLLIADRLPPEKAAEALGRDCFVEADGEASGFGRFISSVDGQFMLVPHEAGEQPRVLPAPDWIAPVVMLIRYL
jgi:transcriptional regulator with XRE-family HTH domain